jgi:hypothetical protein
MVMTAYMIFDIATTCREMQLMQTQLQLQNPKNLDVAAAIAIASHKFKP